jgi:hypothetical protein
MGGVGRTTAALVGAAVLAACASAGPASRAADPAAQIDGKTLEAKPGLGRVYLVHGDIVRTLMQATYANGNPSPVYAPSGGGLAGAFAGAFISGIAQEAMKPSEKPATTDNKSTGFYFMGEQKLGIMGPKQFMALDLPPGEYVFSYQTSPRGGGTIKQTVLVEAGNAYYFWSRADFDAVFAPGPLTGIYPCSDDCARRIQDGVRVVADLPTR